jgi:uridine kinase
MPAMTLARRELLDALSDEFLANYSRGRTVIAVDGVDGAGKTRFADDLAVRLGRGAHPVFRASMDGFHRPRADRYLRGKDSPVGYYEDSYDYDLFRRVLVEPFRMGGSAGFVTAAYDVRRDAQVEMDWKTGPQDATLIVDGVFLNRPELRGLWNWSIWLEVPSEVADARLTSRDGRGLDPRYRGGQALYLAQADPRAVASVIVDNRDPDHPVRAFADSC